LSHCKVLTHVSELCDETQASLTLNEHKYTQAYADNDWAHKLAYVSDILNNLNEAQGSNILRNMDKIQGSAET
jgi:hypothetical protein